MAAHCLQYTPSFKARNQSAPHPSHTFNCMQMCFISSPKLPRRQASVSAVGWARRRRSFHGISVRSAALPAKPWTAPPGDERNLPSCRSDLSALVPFWEESSVFIARHQGSVNKYFSTYLPGELNASLSTTYEENRTIYIDCFVLSSLAGQLASVASCWTATNTHSREGASTLPGGSPDPTLIPLPSAINTPSDPACPPFVAGLLARRARRPFKPVAGP